MFANFFKNAFKTNRNVAPPILPRNKNQAQIVRKTAVKTGGNQRFGPVTPADPLARRGMHYNMVMQRLFTDRKLGGFQTLKIYPGHRYVAIAMRLQNTDTRKTIVTEQFMEDLALETRTNRVRAWRDRGALIFEFESPEMYWRFYGADDVPAGSIGLAGIGRQIWLDFDETKPHAGVFGSSGSGKTTTIRMALYALARKYTPDKMQFMISDPNSHFADWKNEEHMAWPLAMQRPDSDAMIRAAHAEFVRRRENDIKDAARLVVVFDEATEAIPAPARRSKDEITMMVSEMARLGRVFKVSLLFGTQEPSKDRFPGIFSQIGNRYLGKVDSAQTSTFVAGHSQLYAHKLTGKGDFLHILPDGEGLRFQAAEPSRVDIESLPRAEIRPMAPAPQNMVVDYDDQPDDPPPTGGRPPLVVEPETLYQYFMAWPNLPSVRDAHRRWGVSQRKHQMHRDFITKFMACAAKEGGK